MGKLFYNVRFYVLIFSSILAGVIYLWVKSTTPEVSQTITLVQYYALVALVYLYFTLLASPLTRTFTFLPLRGQYLRARRAIGVSTFFFAILHASLAFFGEIGGFGSLYSLPQTYLIAVSLGAISLTILFLMAATAFDFMVSKLTFERWKMLHRLVYLVAILTLIHALMLGSHFQDLSTALPRIFFLAGSFLLILEAIRFDKYLNSKFASWEVGTSLIIVTILLVTTTAYIF